MNSKFEFGNALMPTYKCPGIKPPTVKLVAKALTKLPEKYLRTPWGELRLASFNGTVIVAHPEYEPLIYKRTGWAKVKIRKPTGKSR